MTICHVLRCSYSNEYGTYNLMDTIDNHFFRFTLSQEVFHLLWDME